MVRSGSNGFVTYPFIVDALISAGNGGMSFASGSRPFENQIFKHPRPRNEPRKTVFSSYGMENDGGSSRKRLEGVLGPRTGKKESKSFFYPENPKIPEISIGCYNYPRLVSHERHPLEDGAACCKNRRSSQTQLSFHCNLCLFSPFRKCTSTESRPTRTNTEEASGLTTGAPQGPIRTPRGP